MRLVPMTVGFAVAVALPAMAAVPTFEAATFSDARTAEIAWVAASECTGREATAHATVTIERGPLPGGLLGRAWHDDEGLHRIDLDPSPQRLEEVIVHEVAHAWVNTGPPALREGLTELLADCIVHRRPGLAPLQWDDGRDLDAMPDLKSWSNSDNHGPAVLAAVRTDAYLGAARLMRAAAMTVPADTLWPEEGMDWATFRTALADAGDDGATVLAALDGDIDAQRQALADDDLDGLPTLAEALLGTRSDRWDSNADGWWDGAELGVPDGAIPLPFDGTPVCTGWAAADGHAKATVRTGGNLRGVDLPRATLRINGAPTDGAHVTLPAGASVLVSLDGTTGQVSGGLWARLDGELVADYSCRSTARHTVWSTANALDGAVLPFATALERADARAEDRFGAVGGRIAISLGGTRTQVADNVIHIAASEVQAAQAAGTLDELANLCVALHRVWNQGSRQWGDATAVARAIAIEAR